MREFLIDLALPRSDRVVAVQWAVMAVFWVTVVTTTRSWTRDVRLFIYGIAMMNLAWFALRTVH